MMKIIKKYRNLSFEEKTIFSTRISIFTNAIFAIGKFLISFFNGIFFVIAGIINLFIMIAKLECYLGEKYPDKKSFKYRNNMIGMFLVFAGLEYGIYMARLIFTDVKVMDYDMFLGIMVATISFIELGFAIKGLFNAYGKGHYYRNIKLINFCSALTAMCLTEIAITSFASQTDTRIIDGIFGISVAFIIILIAVYIFIAPKISIVDREHNTYELILGKETYHETEINIQLTNSKFFGNYTYIGKNENNIIDGKIVQGRSPIYEWHIVVKILIIVLSEILIFVYAIGALIYHFKNASLIRKLDKKMLEINYKRIGELNDNQNVN